MPNLEDRVHVRGDLEIRVTNAKGKLVTRHALKNTITYNGITGILRLLINDNPNDWELNQLKAGTNGTPPTRGDTALGAAVITKPTVGAGRVLSASTGTIVYQAQIGPAEATGVVLREAGLFYANNVMFSRMTHPEIDRTVAGFGGLYIWRLTFTV